ncbi:GerAB/ArcD/ProY family transporter [Paenibacillus humicola]|uniref:GerAB/ArcD/ProY family transporter n=1 Tax=Paenibacillus humicola TaxID=3110540 RepID=UPI00237ADC43|nr:endospore germination permease [Paenibacillus humicola]
MGSETVTNKQLIILLTFNIFATIFFSEPRALARVANHTGWLCILLAMACFSLYSLLLLAVIRRMEHTRCDLVGYIRHQLGSLAGRLFALVFVLLPLLLFVALVNRIVAELFTLLILPETPREIILIMVLALEYAMVGGGIGAVARWSQIIMPLVVVMIAFLYSLAVSNAEFTRMSPFFDTDAAGLMKGALFVFSGYAEAGILLLFWRHLADRKHISRSLLFVNAWTGLLFMATFMICIAAMSPAYVKRMVFPVIEVIRDITFFDSIEHLEIFSLIVWMLIILSKGSLVLHACCDGWRSWFALSDYRPLRMPLCIVIYFLTTIPQNLLESIINLESFKALTYPLYAVFMLCCLFAMSLIRKRSIAR